MSVKPTYVCDVCGATRKDANHWFLAWSMPNGCLMLAPWDVPQSPGYHDQPDMKHLCGQVCVHSIVGKWMEQSTKYLILDTEQPLPAIEGAQAVDAPTGAQAGGNDVPESNPVQHPPA